MAIPNNSKIKRNVKEVPGRKKIDMSQTNPDADENDNQLTHPSCAGLKPEILDSSVNLVAGERVENALPSTQQNENSEDDMRSTRENTSELDSDNDSEALEKHNIPSMLDDVTPLGNGSVSKTRSGKGYATVIKTEKNGNRVTFSGEVIEKLKVSDNIHIGVTDGKLVLSGIVHNKLMSYKVKKQGSKSIVYSRSLVDAIVEKLNLDFNDKVSMTFTHIEYSEIDDTKIALISF